MGSASALTASLRSVFRRKRISLMSDATPSARPASLGVKNEADMYPSRSPLRGPVMVDAVLQPRSEHVASLCNEIWLPRDVCYSRSMSNVTRLRNDRQAMNASRCSRTQPATLS